MAKKIHHKHDPSRLFQYGPLVQIQVRAKSGSLIVNAVGQIDTGAGHTCISPGLRNQLGLQASGTAPQQAANAPQLDTPTFDCVLAFPGVGEFSLNARLLDHLQEPTDVLIGRDILRLCHVDIDFTTGAWSLTFKE